MFHFLSVLYGHVRELGQHHHMIQMHEPHCSYSSHNPNNESYMITTPQYPSGSIFSIIPIWENPAQHGSNHHFSPTWRTNYRPCIWGLQGSFYVIEAFNRSPAPNYCQSSSRFAPSRIFISFSLFDGSSCSGFFAHNHCGPVLVVFEDFLLGRGTVKCKPPFPKWPSWVKLPDPLGWGSRAEGPMFTGEPRKDSPQPLWLRFGFDHLFVITGNVSSGAWYHHNFIICSCLFSTGHPDSICRLQQIPAQNAVRISHQAKCFFQVADAILPAKGFSTSAPLEYTENLFNL